MTAFTYSASIAGGGAVGLRQITNTTWLARRIAPPREATWNVQRIRLGAIGGAYMYQTNYNGFGQAVTTNGSMPCAGLWRNRIAPETEVVFEGCVPIQMKSYEPQIPVVLRESDFLIFAAHDAYLTGGAITVNIELDVDEVMAYA